MKTKDEVCGLKVRCRCWCCMDGVVDVNFQCPQCAHSILTNRNRGLVVRKYALMGAKRIGGNMRMVTAKGPGVVGT